METGDKAVIVDTINYMKEVHRAKVKGSIYERRILPVCLK